MEIRNDGDGHHDGFADFWVFVSTEKREQLHEGLHVQDQGRDVQGRLMRRHDTVVVVNGIVAGVVRKGISS